MSAVMHDPAVCLKILRIKTSDAPKGVTDNFKAIATPHAEGYVGRNFRLVFRIASSKMSTGNLHPSCKSILSVIISPFLIK